MKAAILYTAPSGPKSRGDYWCVCDDAIDNCVRVRLEVVKARDLVAALDKAKPRKGETVLNTVELP